jgi:UDP-N-acetylglucosamine acyltransferase
MGIDTEKTIIDPTAIVHPDAELESGVQVGPYAIIEATVCIGEGTKIGPRVTVEGHTTIGAKCEIFTGAVLGSVTQDKKYKGGKSFLTIGDRNKIREYVTMNPGTAEGTETRIGNDNLIMAYAHIAHDCWVGDEVTLANNATLGGHVVIEDKAIVGGLSAVHQFVRIGSLAIVGGCSKAVQDVPPYILADGHPARAYGLNTVGLQRAHLPKEERQILKKAFKVIFRSGLSVKSSIRQLEEEFPQTPAMLTLLDFLKKSERGICK